MLAVRRVVWCLAVGFVVARKPCKCSDLEVDGQGSVSRRSPREVFVVPESFASRTLSRQVALLKVPETGSSTASKLMDELGAKLEMPVWMSMNKGEFERVVSEAPRNASKWALGHRGWGSWLREYFDHDLVDLMTTAREPMARLASSAEKRSSAWVGHVGVHDHFTFFECL